MPSSAEQGPQPPRWWRCLALGDDGAPVWFALVRSGDQPGAPEEGARVQLSVREALRAVGTLAESVAHFDAELRVRRIDVTPQDGWLPPPLWFVQVPEPDASPLAVNLIAFCGHGVDQGSVLAAADLRGVDVVSTDQVGALRWYPDSGVVDQVYVAPDWRRRRVASHLVLVADTLNEAAGRSRLWDDGQRTELGEQWRQGSTWSHLAAPLTHVAPPMTPSTTSDDDA